MGCKTDSNPFHADQHIFIGQYARFLLNLKISSKEFHRFLGNPKFNPRRQSSSYPLARVMRTWWRCWKRKKAEEGEKFRKDKEELLNKNKYEPAVCDECSTIVDTKKQYGLAGLSFVPFVGSTVG